LHPRALRTSAPVKGNKDDWKRSFGRSLMLLTWHIYI
jgi:hypothetical protein